MGNIPRYQKPRIIYKKLRADPGGVSFIHRGFTARAVGSSPGHFSGRCLRHKRERFECEWIYIVVQVPTTTTTTTKFLETAERNNQDSYARTDNTTRKPARAATRSYPFNRIAPSLLPFPPTLKFRILTTTCTTSRTHCTGGCASSELSRHRQPIDDNVSPTPGHSQPGTKVTSHTIRTKQSDH